MPETSPNTVFFGSAKAREVARPPQRIADKVKSFLTKYWEKAGPKSTEDRFVKAFEAVRNSLPTKEAQQAYAKTEKSWRKAGKIAGIAATVIDFGLVALDVRRASHDLRGLYDKQNRLHFRVNEARRNHQANVFNKFRFHLLSDLYEAIYGHEPSEWHINEYWINDGVWSENTTRLRLGDRLYAATPLLRAVAILAGIRPAHIAANLIASGAETISKMKAKSINKLDKV